MKRTIGLLGAGSALLTLSPAIGRAEDAPPPDRAHQESSNDDPRDARFVLGTRLVGRDTGAGVDLDARVRFASGIQLGAAVAASANERAYMTGEPVLGVAGVSGTALFLAPVVVHAPLELDLRLETGVASFHDVGATDRVTLRQVNELGLLAHVALGEAWLLRAGPLVGVELEIGDAVELADQTQLLTCGVGHAIGDSVLVYAEVAGGGTFGFDGDNGKFIFEGALGLRVPFGKGGARVAF